MLSVSARRPYHVRVVALLPLGYTALHPAPIPRKSMQEMVRFEAWDGDAPES